jgi:hypothetical protein
VSSNFRPLNPRRSFAAGVQRLYFFVRFEGMAAGVLWQRLLFRDGETIDGGPVLWGTQTEGETYFFFGNDVGFPAGEYEIRLYLGENPEPVDAASFTVE